MGILLAKDLLRASQKNNTDITPLLRPATFIPESKRLDILLREFRSKASHIAIVVDEYGGVAGLVTIEDVLEQIVGDIEDEYDNLHDSQHIKKISHDEYTVHAQTPIEFFNAYFDTVYPDDEFDTIGGLVLKRFAHLPKTGESLTFDNFQVTVLSASKRRIHLLRFKKKMPQLNNPITRYVLSLFAGSIFPLAFAPYTMWPLALIAIGSLYYCWRTSQKSIEATVCGLLFGCAAFAIGTGWVFHSIHHFGGAPTMLALAITALFVLLFAVQLAGFAWLWYRLFNKASQPIQVVSYACMWVMFELLRSHLFTGFPWLLVGDTASAAPLSGLVPIFGVYGTSLLITIASASLVIICQSKCWRQQLTLIGCIGVLFICSAYLQTIRWTKPITNSQATYALLQGNIPVQMKWDEAQTLHTLQTYLTLTRQHLQQDIIIWPETAIPAYDVSVSTFLHELHQLAKQHHSNLLTGIAHYDRKHQRSTNRLLLLGNQTGHYDKVKLVPFGEYLPMVRWLQPIFQSIGMPMSGFSAGTTQQPLLRVNKQAVATFICYEIAYPAFVRAKASGANWLLVISDDAWFGHSAAAAQQLQIAQIRALESGRPILYANNSAITAHISAQGTIIKALAQDHRGALTGRLTPYTGQTPLMRLAQHFWLYCIASLLIICLLLNQKRKFKTIKK